MSKADQLGRGTAFGAAAGARSSRRDVIGHAIGGDGDTTAAAVTDLPVTQISDNPDNPRNHLRSLDDTVASVREVGVILPIVVATIEAYLHDRSDRTDDLDDGAHYVVVDGHRRLEAARRVGLATIPVRVDNARVSTDETLLEAAFIANYHRDDMTELEEAHALQQLVTYYGSQTKAARRLGIPQNTISSKLSLLKLSPELQKDLATGERTVKHVRNLGKLSPADQKKKADERAAADRIKVPQPSEPAGSPADDPVTVGQVSRRDNPGTASAAQDDLSPDVPAAALPEPRADDTVSSEGSETEEYQPKTRPFPYNSGRDAAYFLIHKMEPDEFNTMLDALIQHRDRQTTV
ncbi:ParB/RepB/Spo0J family partition protein [Streptomyces sp. NPDC001068]|uniref:ParB/RepB/Spo0J family partition protein n=1 Tax=Streptomyces sp. NPDC001068 TaxID=3364544 RepID=UPI00368DCAF8